MSIYHKQIIKACLYPAALAKVEHLAVVAFSYPRFLDPRPFTVPAKASTIFAEAGEASGEFPVDKKTIVRHNSSWSSKGSDEQTTKPIGSPDLSSVSDEVHEGIAYRF